MTEVVEIQIATATAFGVTTDDLLGASRQEHLCNARAVAVMLARDLTKLSYPSLALLFRRDHTTMIHSVRRGQALCESRADVARRVAAIRESLGAPLKERDFVRVTVSMRSGDDVYTHKTMALDFAAAQSLAWTIELLERASTK